ncbi:hypothetical protein HPB47_020328 [Ixodes persulcatus]|uniref:Uncharacterized protein n=1 Tax=Ixodes persulcatus TaxID=34615 RepID=A0AC60QID5_IXOPE|nr:hypothetical protein HPB47_020328 [Ixodes persulcatus]
MENPDNSRRFYHEMNKRARDATEFLWQRIRPQLPKKKDLMTPSTGGYTTLGDAEIPPQIGKPLELGPKFCFEPVLSPPELVTLAKNVAEKAVEGDRPSDVRPRCPPDRTSRFRRLALIEQRRAAFECRVVSGKGPPEDEPGASWGRDIDSKLEDTFQQLTSLVRKGLPSGGFHRKGVPKRRRKELVLRHAGTRSLSLHHVSASNDRAKI